MESVREYNIRKVKYRLQHHPDCDGATSELVDDGLLVTSSTGGRIVVRDEVDWLRDDTGVVVNKNLGSSMKLLRCLSQCFRSVDTRAELEDMVRELYELNNLDGMGPIPDLLRDAVVYIGLGCPEKIGFRSAMGRSREIPEALRTKVFNQLRTMLRDGDWHWGTLYWYPLSDLVQLVDPSQNATLAYGLDGPVEGSKKALLRHFQQHRCAKDRFVEELLRRVAYLEEHGQWPDLTEA